MKYTEEAIKEIEENNALKAELCAEFDKSYHTMRRWVIMNADNGPLTSLKATKIISKTLRKPIADLLEKEEVKNKQ